MAMLPPVSMGSIPACAGEPLGSLKRESTEWVYPRVCGGTVLTPQPGRDDLGLSPRVRGNPGRLSEAGGRRGSIPACAGEPAMEADWKLRRQVYPRVCGGTKKDRDLGLRADGLSPRVRGNLQHRLDALQNVRSIPACAGEPTTSSRSICPGWVYPRVCGGTPIWGILLWVYYRTLPN